MTITEHVWPILLALAGFLVVWGELRTKVTQLEKTLEETKRDLSKEMDHLRGNVKQSQLLHAELRMELVQEMAAMKAQIAEMNGWLRAMYERFEINRG